MFCVRAFRRGIGVLSVVRPRMVAFGVPFGLLACLSLLCVPAFGSTCAWAAESESGAPQWTVTAVSAPTNFVPGDEAGDDVYKVIVENTGSAKSRGEITISDVLPAGVTLDPAGVVGFAQTPQLEKSVPLTCELTTCTYSGKVIPDETLVLTIPVDVAESPPSSCAIPVAEASSAEGCVMNVVRVSGGGAPDGVMQTPTVISSTPAGFGISPGSATTSLASAQAGAHADMTTTIGFDTLDRRGQLAGAPKEVVDEFPPGFAGDLVDTPTCPVAVFGQHDCPVGTQIGVQTLTFAATGSAVHSPVAVTPVYNLAADPGDVAKLGFYVFGVGVQGDVSVVPGSYVLRTGFQDIHETAVELDSVSLTVWGVPTAGVHDEWRWNPEGGGAKGKFGISSSNALVPYLSNPTSCSSSPVDARITSRSWQEPEAELPSEVQMPFGPFDDCDRLRLPSTFLAQPTTLEAYAPSGLDAELGVYQTYENAEGLASAHLNKAVVTLPEGITVNPSAGAGLGSCTEEEYKNEQEAVQAPAGDGCPNDAKLGSVKIVAPAIKEEATGSVYIATPYANPFSEPEHPDGSLLALYVIARIPDRGVLVTSAGKITANPVTGQLTTVFEDLPQLPFTTFTLSFRQGQTSPLVTPADCGAYTATAQLTPWSDLSEVVEDQSPPFEILQGFGGRPCPSGGVPPFDPQLLAGTHENAAGSYSPLDIQITRNDGEQEITGFSSQLPPGLVANLTGVPFCPEADIALARTKTGAQEQTEPSCPAASQIGHTEVGAGVGQVLAYAQGKIYMAGPYEGAPFSIAAITSAKVGPFDLGTVVVHLPLQINPVSAAVSVPAGPADQIPHIIRGIVIHVRDIRVYIDRPNFTLNPTSCQPMSFQATIIGSGASFNDPDNNVPVTLSDPFHASDCANLQFNPTFKVSTSGKPSRENGASLTANLAYPAAPQGTQANIAKVKVQLPKQLPSRLTTLQKACIETTFDTNPANCPAGSIVGTATATTPIIPAPLTGPAYFVSHGGAKFPELIIVLQGYGVTLDLHGETFISKQGITTSTFNTIPDAPVGTFQLNLTQGPHSALAANGNLCKTKLTIPTTFTAQNGTQTTQNTKITVTHCPTHHTHPHHPHPKTHHHTKH
jgi:uncharacterized repeat protein (TIGR01451 family)